VGGAHVALIGAGGNIGSHAAMHVARLPEVGGMTLVDPDAYDESNVLSQNIARSAIGVPKVDVLADRLREIDAELDVQAIAEAVEDVPLGMLRADVLLSCPDSRRARLAVNAVAWRLGIAWIDAGVDATGALARVTVRVPGANAACLECGLGPEDYAALGLEYSCSAGSMPATRSPAWLGGLAASLQASECERLLRGVACRPGAGWQWVVCADSGVSTITLFRRNPACRFDHETWRIELLGKSAAEMSLAEVLALRGGNGGHARLSLHGHVFVRQLVCPDCGYTCPTLQLSRRLAADSCFCPLCPGRLASSGFHEVDALEASTIVAEDLGGMALDVLGFRGGDVVSVGATHYQLGGDDGE
jgi:molybdopterin/thiamine biosynthesis adenylyltransferase